MANSLYNASEVEPWRETFELYEKILKLKAEREKKERAVKLLELDNWFQNQLPQEINKRPEQFLTQEEVIKLMEWKLTRGKFRPRLTQLIQANSSETVKEVTSKAFKCLPDVKLAITELTKLKAVGPATASDSQGEWNEHKVELCLWAHVTGLKYAPELFNKETLSKRNIDTNDEERLKGSKKMKLVYFCALYVTSK
ncbi:uncharacterized protein LOC144632717 isoform X3 [Oculina patagonica]